jgi:hypothetical protein
VTDAGTCTAPPCGGSCGADVFATGQTSPQGLTTDLTNLYWLDVNPTDAGAGIYNAGAQLMRGVISSKEVTNIAAVPAVTFGSYQSSVLPVGDCLALDSNFVYWPAGTNGVFETPIDAGSPTETQVVPGQFDVPCPDGGSCPPGPCGTDVLCILPNSFCVTVNADPGHLVVSSVQTGGPILGGLVTRDVDDTLTPYRMTLYGSGGYVVANATDAFFTGHSSGALNITPLQTFNFSAGTGSTVTTQSVARLALDANNLYWTVPATSSSTTGSVVQASLSSLATQVTIATTPEGSSPLNLTVDANNVYWTDNALGTVSSVPIGGPTSAATILASGQSTPWGIAVDSTYVYWTNSGDGTVRRVHK